VRDNKYVEKKDTENESKIPVNGLLHWAEPNQILPGTCWSIRVFRKRKKI